MEDIQKIIQENKYLTVKDSSKKLKISLSQVYFYINYFKIECKRYKGKKYLSPEKIELIKRNIIRKNKTQITMLKSDKVSENSKTGIRGVFYVNKTKRYEARIQVKGKAIYLGQFKNIEDAKEARFRGEVKYFKPIIERDKYIKELPYSIIRQKFGMLFVLEKSNRKKKTEPLYKCLCDCGKIKYTTLYNLKNGLVKSCGCFDRRKDITGMKFGRLTAIKMMEEKTPRKGAIWLWECDCGNVVSRPLNNVLHTHDINNKSCGCLRKEQYAKMTKFLGVHNVEGTCIERIRAKNLNTNNTSGIKGVVWDKSRRMWQARIRFKGKYYFLGRFYNKNDAAKVRKDAEEKLHGPFLEWYYSQGT